jgi:hypothetical protein
MNVERFGVTRAVNRAADRLQAEYFRDELLRELDALDRHAGKLQIRLAEHTRHNRSLAAFRVQGELRSVALTRRSVLNMLFALTNRFADETSD